MVTREQSILNKTVDILKEYLDPQVIYLFGSRAKGTHRNGSDFDFAVTGSSPELKVQRNIRDALEGFSGLYTIDIIYLTVDKESFARVLWSLSKRS